MKISRTKVLGMLGTFNKDYQVTFRKKNDEVRVMRCNNRYPRGDKPSKVARPDNAYQTVMDVDKQQIRVINVDTITQVVDPNGTVWDVS